MKNTQTQNETNTTNVAPRAVRKSGGMTKFLLVLILLLAGTTFYFYKQSSASEANSQKNSQAEINKIVAKVSKLIVLPADEEPTIATVSDIEKLKGQAFFANAKNGDKVLIYTTAKTAILYDPVANIIVQVAPINIGEPKNAPVKRPVETSTAPATTSTQTTPSGTN